MSKAAGAEEKAVHSKSHFKSLAVNILGKKYQILPVSFSPDYLPPAMLIQTLICISLTLKTLI